MASKHVSDTFSENIDFLTRFYESPKVDVDTIGAKISQNVKHNKLVQLAGELKTEGGAGENVLEDDIFVEDSKLFISTEKQNLSRRTKISLFMLLFMIPLTLFVGFHLMDADASAVGAFMDRIFGSRKYYFISLVIVVYALVPFFMVFEGRKPQPREMIVLATLAALATAGRGAFFMVPNFKPIIAIVIISGISFGAESGFLVGAVTMIVSNFLFGQGPWTPWQMLAMGLIGFLSGLLHRVGLLPAKRMTLCIYGFLVTIFVYGGVMNPSNVLMSMYEITWQSILAAYISGLPVDLVHATSTFIFLWLGAKPLIEKLQRIKVKYGLL